MNIRNSESPTGFKGNILKFIRPSENSIFFCNNPKRIQLVTRLWLGLSHLREHKFKYNFQDTLNPNCNCSEDIESSCHYLLHCSLYTNERLALLNHIVEILLHGRKFLDISSSTNILNANIDFLLKTKRFDERLS